MLVLTLASTEHVKHCNYTTQFVELKFRVRHRQTYTFLTSCRGLSTSQPKMSHADDQFDEDLI